MIVDASSTINTDYLDQYRFIDESSMIIVDPSKPIESHMPFSLNHCSKTVSEESLVCARFQTFVKSFQMLSELTQVVLSSHKTCTVINDEHSTELYRNSARDTEQHREIHVGFIPYLCVYVCACRGHSYIGCSYT